MSNGCIGLFDPRFADDIALIAESEEDLNLMLNYLDTAIQTKLSLKININKTKVLVASKSDQQNTTSRLGMSQLNK